MKWNPKKWIKKEKDLENEAGKKAVEFEDKVSTNNKLYWLFALVIAIGVVALFLILHFVSGVL